MRSQHLMVLVKEHHANRRAPEPGEFLYSRQFDPSNSAAFFLCKNAQACHSAGCTFGSEENMDHNESIRKFEHLMLKEADHAHEAAIELEALLPLLTHEKSRQLAQLQVKASHKQAKEFRELAQQVKDSQ